MRLTSMRIDSQATGNALPTTLGQHCQAGTLVPNQWFPTALPTRPHPADCQQLPCGSLLKHASPVQGVGTKEVQVAIYVW